MGRNLLYKALEKNLRSNMCGYLVEDLLLYVLNIVSYFISLHYFPS